jgi:uncharacterized protein
MRTKNINGTLVRVPPQRTCVSCRKTGDKRGLVRLVRLPDGSVEFDLTGRKAGRGAYVCAVQECLDTGIREGRLEHSLKVTMTKENRDQLVERLRDLVKESSIG